MECQVAGRPLIHPCSHTHSHTSERRLPCEACSLGAISRQGQPGFEPLLRSLLDDAALPPELQTPVLRGEPVLCS